jgi:hypothetical protein
MKDTNYSEFCENLFINWLDDKLSVEKDFGFDLGTLPEPYLTFGNNSEEICFLTTNPGQVMDFQRKSSGGESFFKAGEKYHDLSKRLASHYNENLKNSAKTRILNMYDFSKRLKPNCDGFTQFEISPFHSANFPRKELFSEYVLNNDVSIHRKYIDLLTIKLKDMSCVCVQCGYPTMDRLNKDWFKLISKIFNVEINRWKTVFFKTKNQKPTTGAFYFVDKSKFKVILFNSGANSIPRLDTMGELFEILSSKEPNR